VDWSPFDIVGLDAFRGLRNAATYRDDLRREFAHGKPVAIMEVGCCTFRGAGDYGGAGRHIAMEPDSVTPKPGLVRDEGEQVRHLDDLMPIFEDEGADSVFWFSFAGYGTPHRLKGPDPDLVHARGVDGASGETGTFVLSVPDHRAAAMGALAVRSSDSKARKASSCLHSTAPLALDARNWAQRWPGVGSPRRSRAHSGTTWWTSRSRHRLRPCRKPYSTEVRARSFSAR
jgi:hypothetical protein